MNKEILQTLYYEWSKLETGADLIDAGLTLSDYSELSRILRVLSAHETAHTYSQSVRAWLSQYGVKTADYNGVYCLSI